MNSWHCITALSCFVLNRFYYFAEMFVKCLFFPNAWRRVLLPCTQQRPEVDTAGPGLTSSRTVEGHVITHREWLIAGSKRLQWVTGPAADSWEKRGGGGRWRRKPGCGFEKKERGRAAGFVCLGSYSGLHYSSWDTEQSTIYPGFVRAADLFLSFVLSPVISSVRLRHHVSYTWCLLKVLALTGKKNTHRPWLSMQFLSLSLRTSFPLSSVRSSETCFFSKHNVSTAVNETQKASNVYYPGHRKWPRKDVTTEGRDQGMRKHKQTKNTYAVHWRDFTPNQIRTVSTIKINISHMTGAEPRPNSKHYTRDDGNRATSYICKFVRCKASCLKTKSGVISEATPPKLGKCLNPSAAGGAFWMNSYHDQCGQC